MRWLDEVHLLLGVRHAMRDWVLTCGVGWGYECHSVLLGVTAVGNNEEGSDPESLRS